MRSFSEKLDLYARLAIQVGANLQTGQRLTISAPLEAAEYVRRLVREGYAAGAYDVYVDWHDDAVAKVRLLQASEEALADVPAWLVERYETLMAQRACQISIGIPTPDLLRDVPPARLAASRRAQNLAMQRANEERLAKTNWLLIAAAGPDWARKVYPDEPVEQAVEHLWDTVFELCRIDASDPIAVWREHALDLRRRADYLNGQRIRRLRYEGPGTDLEVELPAAHVWETAEMVNEAGTRYVANIPTEEAFTAPRRDGVRGTVRATKPLNYGGVMIEGIRLELKDGEIVAYDADAGRESLAALIATDEGSRRLGEVALVSQDSPIARSGRLFYNTLYDENASCHLAIGAAIPSCIEGGRGMSAEEMLAAGGNRSIAHVDFMIGSDELSVTGEGPGGEAVPLLRRGRWAF